MPSFRSPERQARKAVTKTLALGKSRHRNKSDEMIHSVGQARSYQVSLKLVAVWLQKMRLGSLNEISVAMAKEYLALRSDVVRQSTLDLDRQALQCHLTALGRLPPGQQMARVQSDIETILQSRAYTAEQVAVIVRAQAPRNALATTISWSTGVRAHELLTLRRAGERPQSSHRTWIGDRFLGLSSYRVYTVSGKGGLVREVAIPIDIANALESKRLSEPRIVRDRGIQYEVHYDVGGGNAWSASFCRVSKTALGWSNGGHGLRHTYAQRRVEHLQAAGMSYQDALTVVSQELGHFRPSITEVYLR